MMQEGLLPLLSILMCPGQVLFLNNAINHGILSPIAYQQAAEMGKSIVFTVDSNCGPLLGTLCSIALWGKGKAKNCSISYVYSWNCGNRRSIFSVYFS